MSRANVQSTAAIESVRTAMVAFVDQVRDALASLELEMRRVLEWLEHDRPHYWKVQTRQAVDAVNDAQAALHRCLMYPIADERPACTDERMALKRAQARLAYCEAKQERVREWMRTVRHELFEYEGRISQLVHVVELDAPMAIGILSKILRRLEEYHAIQTSVSRSDFDDRALATELWPDGASSAASSAGEPANPIAEDLAGTPSRRGDQTESLPPNIGSAEPP